MTGVIVALFLISNTVVIGLPIRGQVLSAATHRPLPHARVLAWWSLESYGLESLVGRGLLQALETETDANGRYFIPAWVRFKSPLLWNNQTSPSVLIFRPEYAPRALFNDPDAQAKWLPMRFSYSQWSGDVIELQRERAVPAQSAGELKLALTALSSDARSSRGDAACLWPKMRRTLVALHHEYPGAMAEVHRLIDECNQNHYFSWKSQP